jgi:molybdate transport system substrate-binding protein
MTLNVFSGGAAQAVVTGFEAAFETQTGHGLASTFGAVGTMRDKLLAGAPCDVVILSAALIAQLEQQGALVPGSARTLGSVATGVAVRTGAPAMAVDSGASLKAAFGAARGLYVPHMTQSSAGIHVANILKQLGLDTVLAGRIHEYPNGATAMREMSQTNGPGMIGCTQVTEILYTPGVTLVGELPPGFELSTVYAAAVCAGAAEPAMAARLVEQLGGPDTHALRIEAGFVV